MGAPKQGPRGATENDPLPSEREEYVMWGFSAHRETLALPTDLHALEGGMLQDAVVALMGAELRALRSVSLRSRPGPN